jgi:hypothetical protein
MTPYELSHSAASRLITNGPEHVRYLLLRARAQRWNEADFHDLIERSLPVSSLSVWKFTRILTAKDGVLGKAAERLRKGKDPIWTAFPKWPKLQEHSRGRETKSLVGDKSFAYGSVELTVDQAIEAQTDLLSLINYPSDFAESGLLALHSTGSSGLSKPAIESLQKLLQLLMACRSKQYASQEDWNQDLKPKEDALVNVVEELLRDRAIPVVPLLNVNVEVSLLAICREDLIDLVKQRRVSARHLEDEEIDEWEVGMFR